MLNQKLHNEQELLDLLKLKDEEAFTKLYRHYHGAIYVYLLQYVKIPHLAEDLVHEVFMKIWDISERLIIKTSFSSYLYRLAHNKAIDALKNIATDEGLRHELFKWIEPAFPETDNTKSSTMHYERLYLEAVSALAPQRQKVFILCREKGKTYDEAAEELGISRNTVKDHMAHAFRFLRNYLSEKGEFVMMATLFSQAL